jgi:hypothetical protein
VESLLTHINALNYSNNSAFACSYIANILYLIDAPIRVTESFTVGIHVVSTWDIAYNCVAALATFAAIVAPVFAICNAVLATYTVLLVNSNPYCIV